MKKIGKELSPLLTTLTTLFLHSKKEQIPTVGSRLSEVKSSYYQGQNATTII